MLDHCKLKALISFSVLVSSAGVSMDIFPAVLSDNLSPEDHPALSFSFTKFYPHTFQFLKAFALLLFLGGLRIVFHLSLKSLVQGIPRYSSS